MNAIAGAVMPCTCTGIFNRFSNGVPDASAVLRGLARFPTITGLRVTLGTELSTSTSSNYSLLMYLATYASP